MSPISAFPSELLLGVFANFADDRATLRACTLVNARWRRPAQAVLHQSLKLTTQAKLASWLTNNAENDYWTERLELKATGTVGRGQAEAAMGRVRGLKELKLDVERAKLGLNCLESDELRRLTSLSLATSFAPVERTVNLPFNLDSLSLTGAYSAYPLELVAALSSSSLTSLSLGCYGSAASDFLAALAPAFPSLRHLHLSGPSPPPAALLPLLASATSLTTLTCFDPSPALLAALPPSVESIEFTKDYIRPSGAEASYADAFAEASLLQREGLKVVRFGRISGATLRNQRGGPELLGECERKGVKVEFGVEAVGKFGIRHADLEKVRSRWAGEGVVGGGVDDHRSA